jgi:SAM-dependent methyltransferase
MKRNNILAYTGLLFILILLVFLILMGAGGGLYIENFSSGKDTLVTDAYTEIEAKLYERVFNSIDRFNMDYDMIKKLTLSNYKKDIAILDAGCGVGQHYNLLYKDYKNTIGVDKSENMLKRAKIKTPTGNYILGDLANENLFMPGKFSHILCLYDTLYHNNSETEMQLILSNLYYWLKKDGIVCLHIIDVDKIDPGPREFTQYYHDDKNRKHAITYFDKFTHDAYWEKSNKNNLVIYNQKYLLENGNKLVKGYKFYIPPKNDIIKMVQDANFKIIDIVELKNAGIDDIDLYILKKNL